MMFKSFKSIIFVAALMQLSSCVTQDFENNQPVIKNTTSNKELAMTRVALGLGYLDMGNNSQAKFNLEKAKKFAPELVEVYSAFAHFYEKVGEDELTVEAYETALKINPTHANTLNNYGVYLCRKFEFEAAEVQFLRAIAVPTYLLVSESYENLAQCQLDNDDFDKSEYYLSKSIKHSPNRKTALLAMVRLQYAMGNYREASRYESKFEKSTRRFSAESLALAMKIYQKMGNRKTSDSYGDMLVKTYPQSWEAKQYKLNGLEHIEADGLAERYAAKNAALNKSSNKKRTVVWSPNNKPQPKKSEIIKTPEHKSVPVVAPTAIAANSVDTASVTSSTGVIGSATATTAQSIVPVIAATAAIATTTASALIPDTTTEPPLAMSQSSSNNSDVISVDAMPENIAEQAKIANATVEEKLAAEALITPALIEENRVEQPIAESPIFEEEYANTDLIVQGGVEENTVYPIAPKNREITEIQAEKISSEAAALALAAEKEKIAEQAAMVEAEMAAALAMDNIEAEENVEKIDDVERQEIVPTPTHTVKSGESIYMITMQYNTHMKTLIKWNDLPKGRVLQPGDVLFVADPTVVITK
jgi:type IV pilus assembly protein PilF